jgi:hypothetical protein
MLKIKDNYNSIFKFLLLASVLVIGIVIGKFTNLNYFTISKEINLIELVSLSATIFLAYIVSKVIEKDNQEKRVEKDLLIKRIDDIYNLIEDSNVKVISGQIKYQDAASHFKRINISLKCIFRILEKTKIIEFEIQKNEILQCIKKLRDLLTNTPMETDINKSNLDNSVKDSIIHFTHSRILEIESGYDGLRDKILILQLEINKG